MSTAGIERSLGLGLMALILILAFIILQPFMLALIWGGLIAFATWPVHARLSKLVKSKVASACLLAVTMALLISTPLVVVSLTFARDHKMILDGAIQLIHSPLPDLPEWVASLPMVGDSLINYWSNWQIKDSAWFADAIPYLQKAGKFLLAKSGLVGSVLTQIAFAILFALWFYIQGPAIASMFRTILSKLIGTSHSQYWAVAANTVQNVINGIMGTALAQGLAAGIGFYIAGIPAPLLLGALTCALSVIPMTPPLIWIPATGWLLFQGDIGWAVFMGLWGMFVISGVDNLIRPLLISRGSPLPITLILLGVLGGMVAFGFLGLFVGPVILALAYTLVQEWLSVQRSQVAHGITTPPPVPASAPATNHTP